MSMGPKDSEMGLVAARFNLTHVVIFSMLIGLLSMLHHPAQDDSLLETSS